MGEHLSEMDHDGSWSYSICEFCAKNAHEKINMVRDIVLSKSGKDEEMWTCPQCGSTKRL